MRNLTGVNSDPNSSLRHLDNALSAASNDYVVAPDMSDGKFSLSPAGVNAESGSYTPATLKPVEVVLEMGPGSLNAARFVGSQLHPSIPYTTKQQKFSQKVGSKFEA